MLRVILTALALVTFSACGGGAPKSADPTSVASAARVELGEMTLGNDKKVVKIHADGGLEGPDGTSMGTLSTNGTIVLEGKTIATLEADGRVSMGDASAHESASISEQGVLTFKTKSESFTAMIGSDGVVAGTNPGAGKLVVTGADTAGKKRAAMLVLVAMVTRSSSAVAPPPPVAPVASP